MKKFVVYYRPRGNEYSFSRLSEVVVRATDKSSAKRMAVMQIGDCYRIVKISELKGRL